MEGVVLSVCHPEPSGEGSFCWIDGSFLDEAWYEEGALWARRLQAGAQQSQAGSSGNDGCVSRLPPGFFSAREHVCAPRASGAPPVCAHIFHRQHGRQGRSSLPRSRTLLFGIIRRAGHAFRPLGGQGTGEFRGRGDVLQVRHLIAPWALLFRRHSLHE